MSIPYPAARRSSPPGRAVQGACVPEEDGNDELVSEPIGALRAPREIDEQHYGQDAMEIEASTR